MQALVTDLGERLIGRVVDRVEVVAFSALKTYDPPLTALGGGVVRSVSRHGKFLDLGVEPGRERIRDPAPRHPPGPCRLDPLATAAPAPLTGLRGPARPRLVLSWSSGAGFDVTEAGTKKSLAISLVRDPAEVPGVARLGPDPLSPSSPKRRSPAS